MGVNRKTLEKLSTLLERTEERYAEHLGYESLVFSQLQMFYAAMLRWNPLMPVTIQLAIKLHDNLLSLVRPYIDLNLFSKLQEVDNKYKGKDDNPDVLRQHLLDRIAVFLEFWDSKGMLLTRLPTDDLVEIGWQQIAEDGEKLLKQEKTNTVKKKRGRPSKKEVIRKVGREGWIDGLQT